MQSKRNSNRINKSRQGNEGGQNEQVRSAGLSPQLVQRFQNNDVIIKRNDFIHVGGQDVVLICKKIIFSIYGENMSRHKRVRCSAIKLVQSMTYEVKTREPESTWCFSDQVTVNRFDHAGCDVCAE